MYFVPIEDHMHMHMEAMRSSIFSGACLLKLGADVVKELEKCDGMYYQSFKNSIANYLKSTKAELQRSPTLILIYSLVSIFCMSMKSWSVQQVACYQMLLFWPHHRSHMAHFSKTTIQHTNTCKIPLTTLPHNIFHWVIGLPLHSSILITCWFEHSIISTSITFCAKYKVMWHW